MHLWIEWFRRVLELRAACSRNSTFVWLLLALAGMTVRCDLRGVTSFVRALYLKPKTYPRFLHFFHTEALNVEKLTKLWTSLTLKLFNPLEVNGRIVMAADGIKVSKEGRKMPAVKKLHQGSQNNAKPEWIFGHSFQAVSLLVRGALGTVFSIPLTSRIHEGVVSSPADKRTLLDKMVQLLLPITGFAQKQVTLVADAYYASRKIINPLVEKGHHLVTRVRCTTVAYHKAAQPKKRKPGRPKLYGKKVRLWDLFKKIELFTSHASPVYNEDGVELLYYAVDLLWKPIGKVVRFVLVDHPTRGKLILLTTDLFMDPLQVIAIYGYRFKIEVGFKQALYTLGAYYYHFWMADMKPIARKSGNQYLHRESKEYREKVKRKMEAYHRYVQIGCIAQGLLQHLSLNFCSQVWQCFGSWLRTMKTALPPSEAVTAQALRSRLPEFLLGTDEDHALTKIIRKYADFSRYAAWNLAG